MFDNQLRPYYQGRVLMNESALNDPAIIAVLGYVEINHSTEYQRTVHSEHWANLIRVVLKQSKCNPLF